VLDWLTQLIEGSAWAYPAIVALVATDGLVPMVPGEGAVLTGSILAADGNLSFALVLLAAFAGALAGDNASYWLGRLLGRRAVQRLCRKESTKDRVAWTRELIRRRGRTMLFITRFVPGGRTATTLAAGSLGMPWRRFMAVDAAAALLWAAYVATLGYVGGEAFEDSLWKPLVLAAAIAGLVTGAGELYRRLRLRRPAAPVSAPHRTG